jgi:hypothetical protein
MWRGILGGAALQRCIGAKKLHQASRGRQHNLHIQTHATPLE